MAEIIYREESYKIMGACFEVYKEKGCGFTEPVYQECLEIEFGRKGFHLLLNPNWNWNTKARNLNNSSYLISFVSAQ